MPSTAHFRPARTVVQQFSSTARRNYSSSVASPKPPRHLLSIADLTPNEFTSLVANASAFKTCTKSASSDYLKVHKALRDTLQYQTIAMMFSKRSTRTRVSSEAAITMMGGHPMFLGKDDIQLGVNESLYDTSRVISSMTSCMVARVGPHSDVANLAKHSSVPVINALSDDFHPLQTIADFLTIHEAFRKTAPNPKTPTSNLEVEGLKIAWVGDSNNVLFDLAMAAIKLGVNISVASPKGYEIPASMLELINSTSKGVASPGKLTQTNVPEEAIKDADILVTDTWISMGQEEESAKRLEAFAGYQITDELAKRGGAKEGWKFMHCLPRHAEEVHDEVFYGPRSLVFPEAENRLWAMASALHGFVVNRGELDLPLRR